MAPVAFGFMILIGAAAVLGVVVGAIGGAVVWRARINLVLGGLLTAGAYLLVLVVDYPGDFTFLRAKLTWGAPPLSLAFLIASISARWLEARTALRPTWITLAACGVSLGLGFLYLSLFRFDRETRLVGALVADVGLMLVLIWTARYSALKKRSS
jgi:hypothetical protein